MTARELLKQFATDCGVTLVDCGEGWGGRIGYQLKDWPNCTTCGFRSENAAYEAWMKDTFGEATAKGLVKLFRKAA